MHKDKIKSNIVETVTADGASVVLSFPLTSIWRHVICSIRSLRRIVLSTVDRKKKGEWLLACVVSFHHGVKLNSLPFKYLRSTSALKSISDKE